MRQNDKAPSTSPPFSSSSWYERSGNQIGRSKFLVSCYPNLFPPPHVHVSHTTAVSASCTRPMYYSGGVMKSWTCQCQSCDSSVSACSTLTMYSHSNALTWQYSVFSIQYFKAKASKSEWKPQKIQIFQTFAARRNYIVPSQILNSQGLLWSHRPEWHCWAHLTEGCSRKELFLSSLFS